MRTINAEHVMCIKPGARSGDAYLGTACIIASKPGTSQTFEKAQSRMHGGVNAASQLSMCLQLI